MVAEMNISITELGKFLRCRRQWWISSSNGMSLKKKGAPYQRYYIGTGFHKACELNALYPHRNPVDMIDDWLETEKQKIYKAYEVQIGARMSDSEIIMLSESDDLIKGLTSRYFEKYGQANP